MTLTGGCLCGAVRFSVEGQPVNVRACHCRLCQKATGAAFWLRAIYPRSAFACEGATASYPSSARLLRTFCPACGTSLFTEPQDAPDWIGVSIPALDDPDALKPAEHIFTSTKLEWLVLDDGLPQHDERP